MKNNKKIKASIFSTVLFLTACGVESPPSEIVKKALEEGINESSLGIFRASFENIVVYDCKNLEHSFEEVESAVKCTVSGDMVSTVLFSKETQKDDFNEVMSFAKTSEGWMVI